MKSEVSPEDHPVSTAAVDDFDIDPDDRIAEITFELDDGSIVYAEFDIQRGAPDAG